MGQRRTRVLLLACDGACINCECIRVWTHDSRCIFAVQQLARWWRSLLCVHCTVLVCIRTKYVRRKKSYHTRHTQTHTSNAQFVSFLMTAFVCATEHAVLCFFFAHQIAPNNFKRKTQIKQRKKKTYFYFLMHIYNMHCHIVWLRHIITLNAVKVFKFIREHCLD